jgi:predicted acyltransferase
MPNEDAVPLSVASAAPAGRLDSVDAYRGFVMFLMMAETLRLASVAAALPGSRFWAFLAEQQSHVEWIGCTLHDLIQPSFTFLVGVVLPFSIASRRKRGQSAARMTVHAFWRAFLLIALGIFLRSLGHSQTRFTFEDTLTQIGLGYGLLFLLGFRPVREQWIALALILVGYWAAFVLYPLPAAGFDYGRVGVSDDWLAQFGLSDFSGHWNKNSNLAWRFDVGYLNLFPREEAFVFNEGGYATLSFIPTLGTMILGLITGTMLRSGRTDWQKVRWMVLGGVSALAIGLLLNNFGVCPVVKRIWTPSWTIYSGGWCLLLLAGFYAVMDIGKRRAWAFPLMVIGMNSITAYCSDWLFFEFIRNALTRHVPSQVFDVFGAPYRPLLFGGAVLLIAWLLLYWMYRKKLFVRI